MIEAGLVSQLTNLGWKVDCTQALNDYANFMPTEVKDYGVVKNAEYVSAVCKSVSESVSSFAQKGQLALTIGKPPINVLIRGGDHSLAMGTISGSARVYPNIGILWIDAHAVNTIKNKLSIKDINTIESTTSGNLHGCPVSYLMGLNKNIVPFEWLQPCLKPSRIVYIGLRDVDPAEKKIIKENGIKAFSMHDVDKHGIGKIMEMAIEYLGECPLHMTFDVDALDPSVAPSKEKNKSIY